MAETAKSEQPQTNGLENGLDEDERSKMRPADIDADVKEMERRKRVEMIMSSKLFREELERIIELQLKDGNGPAGLLQQISDMMGIQSGKLHTTHMFRGSNCVTPINDIRGVESMGYEKGEKNLRCKLASVFRLMDLYGWSQGINNQITARLNQDEEHFLVNPHGMLFNEITASSLVKVDMQGNIVEPGTTNFSVNTQGFLLHSAIHASRPDVNCVIHIKTPSVLAVSSLKCGLLPICQEALVIGEVSQHPFVSGIFEPEEREKIIRNLGPHNKVLLLHNHGAVCCGATVEEAFYNVYNTVLACETQMKLMPIGVENLLLVSDETRKQVYDAAHRAPDAGTSGDKKKFRVGEMEFEALIRMLDNAGFRTGYIYRHPLVKGELPKPKNDVEVPPAVSSLGYLIEQEELYKQGNWKKYIDGRNRLDRTKWLNSPNVYQKVEILETGTSDPKKITKWVDQNSEEWVAESSPTHSSTPVKIDSALQFVPKGTNPKEFKKLQQQIKENRRADKITSGPQSHILEGVSWEEAKKLQDANITQTGDQVILVGAASKGIIQRNYQHNALVYKTPYAKNPFDSMSDKEIEDYKQLVERKQRGDTDYEESQSESEAISSSRQDALRHFKSPLLSPQSATSETEEESRDEPRVLRIETKTAPRPIQAEVVLSDGESDTTDARVERSHSARYPKAEKPESVTLMNSFRKSWSLKREKDKSKDVDNIYESRNLQFLRECDLDRPESLHCYVARVKQLTHKPVIVDLGTKSLRPLLKSASDPCNLSTIDGENETDIDNRQSGNCLDVSTSLSCTNIVKTSELQQRLNVRKKLLQSAKMKFLGYQISKKENEVDDKNSKSPMRVLISEIRDTINEIMSPERSKTSDESEYSNSLRWVNRTKLATRSSEHKLKSTESIDVLRSKVSISRSLSCLASYEAPCRSLSETLADFKNDLTLLKNNERSDTANFKSALNGGNLPEENQPPKESASDDEATYTITDDSLLPTYSFTESTETEWYYNKTIMKLENSQTVLEIVENENKEENMEIPAKYIDTGIDTDFTSDREVEVKTSDPLPVEEQKESETPAGTEDIDNDAPVCESSGLNKSSETDSSFLKSSSGRTSNDVDTSFAFKTETETSEKSPEKSSGRNLEEKKKFLEEMLLKTKEPILEESSDGEVTNVIPEKKEEAEISSTKPEKVLESPEFTSVDTEDAPITSSSKDTSPEVVPVAQHIENETEEPKVDLEEEKENFKTEPKRKKTVKSATKITVKKELKEKNSNEPIVSEIKLTIKNIAMQCQSEKYEVKIQDVTNTSEELSRSVSSAGENIDGYESFEITDKSCDCEAQQNLEDLQDEVSSTIEKLHTIENYFEDEIKKHSNVSQENGSNGSDRFAIDYNYSEFEQVLNNLNEETDNLKKGAKVPELKANTGFHVSSQIGEICGEIEVCGESDVFEGDNTKRGVENDVKNLAVSSAFVAAILSEAVLGSDEQVCEKLVDGTAGAEVELICNLEEVSDVRNFVKVITEEEEVCLGVENADRTGEVDHQEIRTDLPDIVKGGNSKIQNQQLPVGVEVDELNLPQEETNQESKEIPSGTLENQNCQQILDFDKEQEYELEGGIQSEQPKNKPLEQTNLQRPQEDQLSNLQQEETVGRLYNNIPQTEDQAVNQYCQPILGGEADQDVGEHQEPEQENQSKSLEVTTTNQHQIPPEVELEQEQEYQQSEQTPDEISVVNNYTLPTEELDGKIHQHCQQNPDEEKYEQDLQPLDDCWNNHIQQNEDPEDETTFQSCQSGFDFGKEDQLDETDLVETQQSSLQLEETVIWNQKTQPESSDIEQGCQLSVDLTQEIDQQESKKVCDVELSVIQVCQQNGFEEVERSEVQNGQLLEDCNDSWNPKNVENESLNAVIDINPVDSAVNTGQSQDVAEETSIKQNGDDQPVKENSNNSGEIIEIDFNGNIKPYNTPKEFAEDQECQPVKDLTGIDAKIGNELPENTPEGANTCESVKTPQYINFLLNCLLTSAIDENQNDSTYVNDVINFIVNNEESPTNSLTEFEDMENIISTSSSVVADIIDSIESQAEGEVESLPDEDEIKENDRTAKKKKKKDAMFKVTIATPAKKEIFINYSLDQSSTFNTTSDLDQIEELCNSYIKTDDVNDDYENISDFFSVESSGKNSLNSSFCSVEESGKGGEQFCCVGCENNEKSPHSLAIIQEVDEGDSSASSEVTTS